jgi:hypothetical protein
MIGKLGEKYISSRMKEMGGCEGMRALDKRAEARRAGCLEEK